MVSYKTRGRRTHARVSGEVVEPLEFVTPSSHVKASDFGVHFTAHRFETTVNLE